MAEGRSGRLWEWIGRIADFWSVTEPIRKVMLALLAMGGLMTPILNWLGIPWWQAAIIATCIIVSLVTTAIGAVRIGRLLSPADTSESVPLSRRTPTTRPRYIGIITGALLVALLAYAIYLHSLLQGIRRDLYCYATPRHLTSRQTAAIAGYLQERKPYYITIRFTKEDKEAQGFAKDLGQAFTQGYWDVSIIPMRDNAQLDVGDDWPFGLKAHYSSNGPTQIVDRIRHPKDPQNPGETMHEALMSAGLERVHSYTLDEKLKDQEYTVVITVGPRPYSFGCDSEATCSEDNHRPDSSRRIFNRFPWSSRFCFLSSSVLSRASAARAFISAISARRASSTTFSNGVLRKSLSSSPATPTTTKNAETYPTHLSHDNQYIADSNSEDSIFPLSRRSAVGLLALTWILVRHRRRIR
jgi:hypothetical protein